MLLKGSSPLKYGHGRRTPPKAQENAVSKSFIWLIISFSKHDDAQGLCWKWCC
jgi:hypothetical protein